MSDLKDIFIEEQGNVVLAKDYLRAIPEFRTLLEKKILVKGDTQGALKRENFKLFVYIKIVADLFSYPNQEGLSEKEVHKIAIKEALLPDDYKADKDVLACIDKYREIQKSCLPSLNVLASILRSLNLSTVIIKGITQNMEHQLEMFNSNIQANKLDETSIAENMLLMNSLIEQLEKVNKIAITVPKIVETMEDLKGRISKEEAGVETVRGGYKKSEFADERN